MDGYAIFSWRSSVCVQPIFFHQLFSLQHLFGSTVRVFHYLRLHGLTLPSSRIVILTRYNVLLPPPRPIQTHIRASTHPCHPTFTHVLPTRTPTLLLPIHSHASPTLNHTYLDKSQVHLHPLHPHSPSTPTPTPLYLSHNYYNYTHARPPPRLRKCFVRWTLSQ